MGTPNTNLVLAGTGAAGSTGASLVWVAEEPTSGVPAAPTDATTVLGTGWKDCGYISTNGVTDNISETKKEIYAYGVLPPVRELVTQSLETFDIGFLETNTTVLELFYRLTLGTITVATTTGVFTAVTNGPARVKFFQMVIDMVDGTNHIRTYIPKGQVTDRKGFQIQAGTELQRDLSVTAYPDDTGNSSYTYIVVPSLG